jgi:hypothetical protein
MQYKASFVMVILIIFKYYTNGDTSYLSNCGNFPNHHKIVHQLMNMSFSELEFQVLSYHILKKQALHPSDLVLPIFLCSLFNGSLAI